VVWNGVPGGGAVNSTYVVDSTFTDNRTSTQGFGGAIFLAGNGALTILRARFENNAGGGAVYSLLAGLEVVDSAFVGNRGTSGWQGRRRPDERRRQRRQRWRRRERRDQGLRHPLRGQRSAVDRQRRLSLRLWRRSGQR
jgi:hypothetical protein